jgi:hypothetical protein
VLSLFVTLGELSCVALVVGELRLRQVKLITSLLELHHGLKAKNKVHRRYWGYNSAMNMYAMEIVLHFRARSALIGELTAQSALEKLQLNLLLRGLLVARLNDLQLAGEVLDLLLVLVLVALKHRALVGILSDLILDALNVAGKLLGTESNPLAVALALTRELAQL